MMNLLVPLGDVLLPANILVPKANFHVFGLVSLASNITWGCNFQVVTRMVAKVIFMEVLILMVAREAMHTVVKTRMAVVRTHMVAKEAKVRRPRNRRSMKVGDRRRQREQD